MKSEVNEMIQRFGQENPPPPAQVFTVKNAPGDGNIHLIQKVFKGAFEVLFTTLLDGTRLTLSSSISCSILGLLQTP
jgi:hypothetical protein